MRVILLAAGLGTRLRPLTEKIPKCLMPIRGSPLLELLIQKLINIKVDHILINTHYLADEVNLFIKQSPYKEKLTPVFEQSLLGTAGTLIKNIDFYSDDDGMLIHADNYFEEELISFVNAHKKRPSDCLMTMMLFHTDKPSEAGIVEMDNLGRVTGFYEKSKEPHGFLANGAIYILSKTMIKILKENYSDAKDFSLEIIPRFIGKIYGYKTNKLFLDIGTLDKYNKVK
jgi:mannose-1-phosphate guanylyltransferase